MLETNASSLLNQVLKRLENHSIFETLGKEHSLSITRAILELAEDYDGDRAEILKGVGESLGLCYRCGNAADHLIHGVCSCCIANGVCRCEETKHDGSHSEEARREKQIIGYKGRLLDVLVDQFSGCQGLTGYTALMERVKEVIPHNRYCTAMLQIGDYGYAHMDRISWFRSVPKLEKLWLDQQLYKIDPVLIAAFREIAPGKRWIRLFWAATCKALMREPDSRTAEYLAKLIPFKVDPLSGCTWLYRMTPTQYFLFGYEGAINAEEPPEIEKVLIPAMALAYERVGRGSGLSWNKTEKKQKRITNQ